MRKAASSATLVLLLACAVAYAAAEGQTNGVEDKKTLIHLPGLPPLLDPQIAACWKSLHDVEGCVSELIFFLLNGRIGLGPACCKAILEIGSSCWPKMCFILPISPLDPSIVQNFCSAGPPSPAPPHKRRRHHHHHHHHHHSPPHHHHSPPHHHSSPPPPPSDVPADAPGPLGF